MIERIQRIATRKPRNDSMTDSGLIRKKFFFISLFFFFIFFLYFFFLLFTAHTQIPTILSANNQTLAEGLNPHPYISYRKSPTLWGFSV